MTTTLIIERMNNYSCSFPFQEAQSTHKKSYYEFYQLKLRQLLTQNRCRQEQYAKHFKQNQIKTQLNHKLLHREYMNYIRQTMKIPLHNDNYRKKSTNILSIANQRNNNSVSVIITTTNISTTNTIISTESRPKSILKTKQSLPSLKSQRVLSAPTNNQKNLRKKVIIKLPKIAVNYAADYYNDDDDDNLSKSNAYSYTQVSSSSQNETHNNYQRARQSTLNTIMLHLNSNAPSDISRWNLYRDFDDKFSASISPIVYRDFERIIL
ncbi:unnamed protein product [Rotaria sordida]|uniref:Uncharacterized protein n=1 Tax=Rotaria sordida TaxID=392033 RepID=A0A819DI17_9BILA|nr:unnamed protein product [Rotaria sordida]